MSLQSTTQELQQYIATHTDFFAITENDIKDIYQNLIDCLTDHNHLYYIENNPILSDKEYDDLFTYLKKIEEYFPHLISSNSPTQQLIWQISEWFSQAKHTTPQLSLENSYNAQDLADRDEFILKHLNKSSLLSSWAEQSEVEGSKNDQQETIKIPYSYIIEPKFDGISVEVIYKDGYLDQAITRGDGITGDDITTNVKTIQNLPKKISTQDELHLRGEIMMPKSVRKQINTQREKNDEMPFANTRNAAAGSIKLLDSNQVAKRGLICYIYDLVSHPEFDSGSTFKTHEDILQWLKNLWLPIFDRHKKYEAIQDVIDTCLDPKTQQFFDTQDNDFDGLVIKINELENRQILWTTQHHPRRAMAYKFPAQQMSTQIHSIERQVGRSGIITPVANLEPVQLSGVTISRVSLHNIDFITSKDIQLHDYVWIQRSGEVIPYITGVIKERRENTQTIIPPTHCPSCSHETKLIDMHTYCINNACPAQLQEKIEHFVSKQCMDIEGIGESIATLLVKQGLVTTVDQLYQFTKPEKQLLLRTLPWFADKKINEIAYQLEQSKKQPLRRLLHGLGIPHIGKKTAMMIQESISSHPELDSGSITISKLTSYLTNQEFLEQIYGIGDKMILALQAFFHDTTNIQILQNLVDDWVNISPDSQTINTPFSGIHFCITGSFDLSRDTIIAACEAQGMIFDPSPTSKTQYLLVGDKWGSKVTKAEELWTQILSWRPTITTNFHFLSTIKTNTQANKPTMESLF